MDELVQLTDVRARRGDFELVVERWSVPPGQVVGIVGANGAGKTTLLELLPGYKRPDAGQVRVVGHDPWVDVAQVRQQLGFMSDDMELFPGRVDGLFYELSGYYPTWDADWVQELVGRFSLDTTRKVHELSKGEGTRLRLVVALAHRPRLVVLDEPATGLDIQGRRALLRTVVELAGGGENSVLVSSHDLVDVERISDRLLALHNGRVVADGPTDELVAEGQTLEEAMLGWMEA